MGSQSDPDEVFRMLGSGDLHADAKTLFCLCQDSRTYQTMVSWYGGALVATTLLLVLLATLPCCAFFCFVGCSFLDGISNVCCPTLSKVIPKGLTDRSCYYDPDML